MFLFLNWFRVELNSSSERAEFNRILNAGGVLAVINMICMEGVEVATVNDKVREVEGGVKV